MLNRAIVCDGGRNRFEVKPAVCLARKKSAFFRLNIQIFSLRGSFEPP
jgi:hypothetical protein